MKAAVSLTVVFLVAACHGNGSAKLPLLSTSQTATSAAPSAATTAAFTDADFTRHIASLKTTVKKKLAAPDARAAQTQFAYVIQKPFVVVGDEPETRVREHAKAR
jgi:hypothetical protein